jgi:hypothetical protein
VLVIDDSSLRSLLVLESCSVVEVRGGIAGEVFEFLAVRKAVFCFCLLECHLVRIASPGRRELANLG